MTDWLTTPQAAAYAQVSENTIRDAAQRGLLSATKITPGSIRSKWRFTHADLDAWLERGRIEGGRPVRRRQARPS